MAARVGQSPKLRPNAGPSAGARGAVATDLSPLVQSVGVQTTRAPLLMERIMDSGLEQAQEDVLWKLHTQACGGGPDAARYRRLAEHYCDRWDAIVNSYGGPEYARDKQLFERELAATDC